MTLAPPERSGAAADPAGSGSETDDLVVRRVVRRREGQRRRRRRRLLAMQAGATVVCTALLVALVWVGWNSTMRITGGRIDAVTDPAAPGYVAAVRPTSVTLIAFTVPAEPVEPPPDAGEDATAEDAAAEDAAAEDAAAEDAAAEGDGVAEGEFGTASAGEETERGDRIAGEGIPDEGVTDVTLETMLMVIEGDDSTAVVPIASDLLLWNFEEAPVASAQDVFATGGADVLRLRLGADATFGSTNTLTLPLETVTDLAEQVGDITISVPDDVLELGPEFSLEVRYPAGELTLEPAEVAEFLAFNGLNEQSSSRILRSELVWEALLDAGFELPGGFQLSGDDDVEQLDELLSNMENRTIELDSMPIEALPIPADPSVVVSRIDQAAISGWVATHVSFPIAAYPGQRARVRLLNGTNDENAPAAVAPVIVSAGGEVVQTGNAEAFDLVASRVEYASPEAQSAAERIGAAVGLSAEANPDLASDADVEVVVGSDRAA